MHRAGPLLILLTNGEHGATISTPHAAIEVDSPKTKVVDATGAGDACMGMFLAQMAFAGASPSDLKNLTSTALYEWGNAACYAGAQCITKVGATTAMCRSLKI